MAKYYCPDHPKRMLYDDTPKEGINALIGAFIRVSPTVVECPVDNKAYYLRECTKKDDLTLGS